MVSGILELFSLQGILCDLIISFTHYFDKFNAPTLFQRQICSTYLWYEGCHPFDGYGVLCFTWSVCRMVLDVNEAYIQFR